MAPEINLLLFCSYDLSSEAHDLLAIAGEDNIVRFFGVESDIIDPLKEKLKDACGPAQGAAEDDSDIEEVLRSKKLSKKKVKGLSVTSAKAEAKRKFFADIE